MKKSKQNQLTGGEETPAENVPQQALLLCCRCLLAAAGGGITGSGDAQAEDEDGTVMRAGTALAVGCDVGHNGLQVGT